MLTFKQYTNQVSEGAVDRLIAGHLKNNFYTNTEIGKTITGVKSKIKKAKRTINFVKSLTGH